MREVDKMVKVDKYEFFKELVTYKTSTIYEKKKVEEYDPEKELEEKELGIRQEDAFDEIKESDLWDDIEEETEGFTKDILTRMEFTNPRISKKFELNLVHKYEDIVDRETLFGFALDVINDYIYKELKEDYIYIEDRKTERVIDGEVKLGYHDSISIINFRLDKRINNYIDEWLGTCEVEKDGQTSYYSPPTAESLDTELNVKDEEGNALTIGDVATEKANIFYDDMGLTDKELDKRLNEIYKQAKLTDREIEVLQVLERTPNNRKGETYTKVLAAELLNCGSSNISNIFGNAKRKIRKFYRKETRQDKLIILNEFLDSIEDEKTVIGFILKDLKHNYMEYLVYYSKLDRDLVRYFNLNNKDPENHYTATMRKFCTYFIKEVYQYEELVKNNIKMENLAPEPLPKQNEQNEQKEYKDIDTNIYTYILEDKLEEHERVGKHIIIDNNKYYYVATKKQKEPTPKVGKYKQITFLKR